MLRARTSCPVVCDTRLVCTVLCKVRRWTKHGAPTAQEQTRGCSYRLEGGVGFQGGGQSRGGRVEQIGLPQTPLKRELSRASLFAKVTGQTGGDEQETGSEQKRSG